MKRFSALVLSLLLILGLSVPAFAVSAADIDLSGLSYEELVALKDRINLAIWESEEWEEVEVPIGVWEIGADIPAGHWTIAAADGVWCSISRSRALDSTGKDTDWGTGNNYFSEVLTHPNSSTYDPKSDPVSVDLVLSEGEYFVVDNGNVVFTPYAGKGDLGFKGGSGAKNVAPADNESEPPATVPAIPDTDDVVGEWSAIEVILDGESDTSTYLCSQLGARIRADGTGYLTVAGEKANFDWEYLSTDDESHIYNYNVDGDESGFLYFIDPSHDYYHNLVVLLDEENIIIFEKD